MQAICLQLIAGTAWPQSPKVQLHPEALEKARALQRCSDKVRHFGWLHRQEPASLLDGFTEDNTSILRTWRMPCTCSSRNSLSRYMVAVPVSLISEMPDMGPGSLYAARAKGPDQISPTP